MHLNILKVNNIEKAPEILIYFWIETLGDFIHCMQRAYRLHDASVEVLSDADRARKDQEILVDILKGRDGFKFADHAEYMLWYRWWNKWHKYELSDEDWNELNGCLKWDGTQTEETFVDWRPDGDWRN